MIVRYKLIEHERLGDAPFCGALISAINCKFNCKNCFNQNIKNLPTQYSTPVEIIKKIKSNIFNKGIILSGLEWTLQIDEAVALAKEARNNGLLVMIYTGGTISVRLWKYFDYIKIGSYDETKATINHVEFGVSLASSNQHILKRGVHYDRKEN